MSDPKDDAELAKAIKEHTIQVNDPPPPVKPTKESRKPGEAEPHEEKPVLGHDVADFEIDVPPPEGI